MKTRKNAGTILMSILAAGILFSGLNLRAEETTATQPVYIAVPMCMFNKLTGKEQEKPKPEFYTYQDGKLAKTDADLSSILKNNCRKGEKDKDNNCRKGKKNRWGKSRGMMRDGKIVLLTQEQMQDLCKAKMEAKGKDVSKCEAKMNEKFAKALENAKTVKINGQDAKVITIRELHKMRGKDCRPCPMMNKDKSNPDQSEG